VLQIRDETGRVSRRVIRGTDFLKIEEKGVSIEIVELGERAPTFQGQLPDLLIYAITSSPLDARTAQSIWTRLSDVRARGISIDLRQDPWFIHDDSAVLLFNAFDTIPRAPTLEESRRVRRLSCIGPPSEPRPSCLLHLGANPAGDGAEKATGPSARKPQ